MLTIDLSYDVAKEMRDDDLFKLSDKFPFNNFKILCPIGIVFDQKILRQRVREQLPYNATFIEENIAVDKVKNNKCTMIVKVKKKNINVKLLGKDEKLILKLKYNKNTREIRIFDYDKDFILGLNRLQIINNITIKIIFSVIQLFINSADDQKNKKTYISAIKKEIKKSRPISKSKSKQNNSVIYINKNNYNKRKAEYKSRRTYTRYKDNWFVRGHYRRYRDKEGNVTKKVWIKSHIRGEEKSAKEIENKRVYKIS
ncbi:MAG: hypothetical protein ACOCP8_06820 [archaeon]